MADDTTRPSLLPSTSAPQPREVLIPDQTSDTYAPFRGQITGTIQLAASMMTLWTPIGTTFVVRGGYMLAVCLATCTGAAAAGILGLFDGSELHPFFPVGLYFPAAQAVGEVIVGDDVTTGTRPHAVPWRFDLGKGYRSMAASNKILLGGTNTIGTGIIYVQGMLWGIQG